MGRLVSVVRSFPDTPRLKVSKEYTRLFRILSGRMYPENIRSYIVFKRSVEFSFFLSVCLSLSLSLPFFFHSGSLLSALLYFYLFSLSSSSISSAVLLSGPPMSLAEEFSKLETTDASLSQRLVQSWKRKLNVSREPELLSELIDYQLATQSKPALRILLGTKDLYSQVKTCTCKK